MSTQNILTLAIGAPLLIACLLALFAKVNAPKKVPVRVRKNNHNR
jgi:hypothetical protein